MDATERSTGTESSVGHEDRGPARAFTVRRGVDLGARVVAAR